MTLDSSGSVLGRQAHLPFGEDFAEGGTQEKHHFTSYERDGESGTDYAVNRQYSQGVGKFLRVDPSNGSNGISDPRSLNRYVYAHSDPINAVDPLGLWPWGIVPLPDGSLAISFCFRSGELSWCEWRIITENEPKYQAPNGRPHPCPAKVKAWFKKYYDFFANMAKTLGVPVEYIIAIATAESGWPANYRRNNPFNSPPRGRYSTLEAARDAWIARWGKDVSPDQTIEQFAQKLWEDGYDTEDAGWRAGIATQYNYIVDHEYDCTK
jgi:RHS repeat-associated protein